MQRIDEMTLVFGVAPPVSSHEIDPAVSVEIAGGDAVPPARILSQAKLRGGFTELSLFITKDADRAAFAGERQFGQTIAIQVSPDRAADQPDLCQGLTGLRVHPERSAIIAKEERRGRFRVATRNNASPDK